MAKGPQLEYDQNVTPEVIFGSGNSNGLFTTGRSNGIEVGLRSKLRFPTPHGTVSNGDGTYPVDEGDACPGYGFAPFPLCLATPMWSFDWSINVDYTGETGHVLSDFVYELGLDSDPSDKTDFTVFDPVSPSLVAPWFDHSLGDNSTTASSDVIDESSTYADKLDLYNVAQNSWNYEFFNNLGTSLASFDPAVPGNYIIYLKVMDPVHHHTLAESVIQILVGGAAPIHAKNY